VRKGNLKLLLQLVYADGDVAMLRSRGLEYHQIAEIVSIAISDGLITIDENDISLTEKGLKYIHSDIESGAKQTDGGWISPLDHLRINQIQINGIYIPKRIKHLIDK